MKPPKAKIALLRSIPGLSELSDREAGQLSRIFDERRVPAGTVLASAGRPIQELVLIADGEATVTQTGNDRYLLGPGDFVGELVLLGNIPHSSSVSAKTRMQILVAHHTSLATIMEHPILVRDLATHLARRLQDRTQTTQFAEPRPTSHIADLASSAV